MSLIPFNIPFTVAPEVFAENMKNTRKYAGDGVWTKKCTEWFGKELNAHVLLTTSCTHALEMMALLIDVKPGDEIIMPSYTFVSTANAFVLRGAKVVFVDINPKTMNIDEKLIEKAITNKTKAIMVVHYAGVSCEMNVIKEIADRHKIYLLEDAAQGMMSTYDGKPLGTIGHLGTYSFHETKNYNCGEGGLLIINDESLLKNAEIIREKGTDRSSFLRGEVDKYTWQTVGSSYLSSDLNAAYLYPQLEQAAVINQQRRKIWTNYYNGLKPLADQGVIEIPFIPANCEHNAHLFYLKLKNLDERNLFIAHMKQNNVQTVSHYVPLHSAPAGKRYATFSGDDIFTTKESERLVRLPLFYDLTLEEADSIVKKVVAFFK